MRAQLFCVFYGVNCYDKDTFVCLGMLRTYDEDSYMYPCNLRVHPMHVQCIVLFLFLSAENNVV